MKISSPDREGYRVIEVPSDFDRKSLRQIFKAAGWVPMTSGVFPTRQGSYHAYAKTASGLDSHSSLIFFPGNERGAGLTISPEMDWQA